MPFQGAEEEQSEHRRVCALFDSITGQQCEQACIVLLPGCLLHGFPQLGVLRLFGQNGGIQRTFGRKVLEEQRFAHAGSFCDCFRRGALKAIGGKQ